MNEFEKIEYLIGDSTQLQEMTQLPAWKPFDEHVIEFLSDLSGALLKEKNAKQFTDLVALAFWLRRGNIKSMCNKYVNDAANRLGRGLVFHIAPGNVALSFSYSLATGLLTGNTNVIRLPSSRQFEQADLFCSVLSNVLLQDKWALIAKRICLIKYPHDKRVTDAISLLCHSRIIWGGDNTISTIRQSPIPPRANEIAFANRFSICLIDADKYLSDYEPKKTARDFYNDTYLSDQNACSSPRIIFWHGMQIEDAKKIFWQALFEQLGDYYIAPVTTVDKMLLFCRFAAENQCRLIMEPNCKIARIKVETPIKTMLHNIGNSGYFYECDIKEIDEIINICTWECQTLSCIGYEPTELRELILSKTPYGVDRIVPVGRTMDFGFVWDGIDIVFQLTRLVEVV